MDGDKPNDKKQKKSLTQGAPAQLARKVCPRKNTLSQTGGPAKFRACPWSPISTRSQEQVKQVNPMLQLISSQQGQKHWPDLLPSTSYPLWHHSPLIADLVHQPASCLLVGYNSREVILLVVSCNNRIWGPYWVPPGKYECNKLTWKTLCTPLTFPVSYNLYAIRFQPDSGPQMVQ